MSVYDPEQGENIERVSSRIAGAITEFCSARIGKQFFMEELRLFVSEKTKPHHIAPASPDRILRLLRQQGKLDYKVVSRSQSLYAVLPRSRPSAALKQPSLF